MSSGREFQSFNALLKDLSRPQFVFHLRDVINSFLGADFLEYTYFSRLVKVIIRILHYFYVFSIIKIYLFIF